MNIKQWWANLFKPDPQVDEFVGIRQFEHGAKYIVSAYFKLIKAGIVKRNFMVADWHLNERPKTLQISIRLMGREMVEGDL